jgi:protein kinase A
MPSLGFLKKKRTKDSSQPTKDADASTAASKTTTAANTTTAAAADTKSAPPESAPETLQQDSGIAPGAQDSVVSPKAEPMTSAQASPQSHGVSTANVPSIQNLLNTNNAPATSGADSQSANGSAVPVQQPRTTKGKYTLPDFQIQRTLGTGSFGRVHLVQSKHNQRFYAIKVLKKAQVVKMKQVEHTNDERRMLQQVKHPFLITLWGTFQDSKNLYMVMDFVEGGELFSLLRKSQVRPNLIRWEIGYTNDCEAIPQSSG